MSKSIIEQYQYLIIGGTTKAATTSLFNYLAAHPDVCITTMKETRFFIDVDYPVQPYVASWRDGIDKFDDFFNIKEPRLRIDATPDYLYSDGTPNRLKDFIPHTKMVFILRDPVSRLISWYKFAMQRNCLPADITFEQYVDMQLQGQYFEQSKQERSTNENLITRNIPQSYFFSALEHGRYAKYIDNYFQNFGRDNVKVFFYEDLSDNPRIILNELCDFVGIPSKFYDNYDFKIFNKSQPVKSARLNYYYSVLRARIRRHTHNLPIHSVLRQLRQWFDPIYYRFNACQDEVIEVTPAIYEKLERYYSSDVEHLQKLLGCKTPWSIGANREKLAVES